jgi:hypothetical protein
MRATERRLEAARVRRRATHRARHSPISILLLLLPPERARGAICALKLRCQLHDAFHTAKQQARYRAAPSGTKRAHTAARLSGRPVLPPPLRPTPTSCLEGHGRT